MQKTHVSDMRSRRVLSLPVTRLGWLSLALFAAFFVFFGLFWIQANDPSRDRSTFFSDPINAALLIAQAASAIGGGVVALAAIVVQRERSIALLPVLLIGAFALFFVAGELIGHH